MYNDQQRTRFNNAKRNPTLFILTMLFVVNRKMLWITKNRSGLPESYLVFTDI